LVKISREGVDGGCHVDQLDRKTMADGQTTSLKEGGIVVGVVGIKLDIVKSYHSV
jgi:hypothetical protein